MKNNYKVFMQTAIFLLWNFTAITIFFAGFHNIDLAYNLRFVYSAESMDCNSFNCMTLNERYSYGLNGMMVAFAMVFIEVIIFSSIKVKNMTQK
jgi:hypothetical protein